MLFHELKTCSSVFKDILDDKKLFEYRKNDRRFSVGDKLRLREWASTGYTGNTLDADVTYILYGGRFGIPVGFCIMGIRVMRPPPDERSDLQDLIEAAVHWRQLSPRATRAEQLARERALRIAVDAWQSTRGV